MALTKLIRNEDGEITAIEMNSGPESTCKKPDPLFMEKWLVEGTENTYHIPWDPDTGKALVSIVNRAANRRLCRSAEEAMATWLALREDDHGQ